MHNSESNNKLLCWIMEFYF